MEVSVVVPAKDEEKTIGDCLDKINQVFDEENIEGEIIVPDSSDDRTPVIAREKGARVIHPDEEGYGNAYLDGMSEVRGGYVVMGDADDTYDFYDIPKLLEPLQEGEAEMVVGNRVEGGIKEGAMSTPHKIGQPIMTGLLNLFHRTGVSDAHSGFRAFKREALKKMRLQAGGMAFASELIIEADRRGLNIEEIPIELHPRREGSEPKYDYFSDSWDHLKLILLRAPTKAFAVPGVILLFVGMILLGGSFLNLTGPEYAPPLLGSLMLLVGSTMTGAGAFVRHLGIGRDLVDHDVLSKFFSNHFTPGRGFWIGLFLFGIGLLPLLPFGVVKSSVQQHALFFTSLCLGIEVGFLSVAWDLVGE
ncbi:hypothetical protein AKJ57_00455 [candidate division MSBL1 archaeon SCGC-AAA259A05]|uniref:Glycosyltransferase 2-like domain-containing protein n=1 Tax=candidate division MSBL1 archaeon SCGC-AAA259A05 TaxID=1698259 RepID=A0A133UBS6_9EURY|nr:hypothetical protein AKJ57_00455 [candidate division MSBL1 archaeon SCGC-AAA259A05]